MASARLIGYLLPALLVNLLLVVFIHRIVSGQPTLPQAPSSVHRINLLSVEIPAAASISQSVTDPLPQPYSNRTQATTAEWSPPTPELPETPRIEPPPLPQMPIEISRAHNSLPDLGEYQPSRPPPMAPAEPRQPPAQPSQTTTQLSASAAPQGGSPAAESRESLKPNYRNPPVYPRRAKRSGVEGQVTVEFTVTREGRVSNPKVIRATPPGVFERAVLRSLPSWRFDPLPAEQRVVQDITFRLTGD